MTYPKAAMLKGSAVLKPALKDAVYGAAVGDALGVPYEFCGRTSFAATDMEGGGTHGQPAGTWSDDTSMMLAICDSIKENGSINAADIRSRFVSWMREGDYAVGGELFDIGTTVSRALLEGRGLAGERDNGNGALMRTVPLAFSEATDDDVREVSAITHAHPVSKEACVAYVHIARELADGRPLEEAVAGNAPDLPEFGRLPRIAALPEGEIKSGGFVVHTLEAALWCLFNSGSYAECALKAVNLGGDTDTTACVAGGLAGIMYGYDAIPPTWIEALRGKDIIERCLF